MRNFYSSLFLISALLVLAVFISSCSDNDEDASAPIITINKPAENDTIHLTKSNIYIELEAENNAEIDNMVLKVITQSGTILYTYEEDQIDKHKYTCSKNFTYNGIDMVTKVKLIVTCENEFHAWRKKEVNFYLTR